MDIMERLKRHKNAIVNEIADIGSMRKGVLNTQFVTAKKKDGSESIRGPYYVLTRKGPQGKTVSKAVCAKDAEYIRVETENYKKFKKLTENYIEVCEQLSIIQYDEKGQCND